MNVIRWLCGAVPGVALGILLMAPSATAQFGGPPAAHGPRPRTTPESIAAGKALFEGTCANCHGVDGSGANGPNIRDAGTRLGPEALYQTIHTGVMGSGMPSFASLGEEKLWQLVDYVSSFGQVPGEAASGDPQKGKVAYEANGCANCHMIDGHGGSAGPDLSKVGTVRSAALLRNILLDPGANIPTGSDLQERAQYPAYSMYRVIMKNGKELLGTRVDEDSFTIQLRDANGNVHSIQKFDAKRIEPDADKSFMPSYKGKLTDEQLNDLVAYLASLGGAQ
jgi:cytochrome c oxidase cbb3-type subunit III